MSLRNTSPFVLIMGVLLVAGCGAVTAAPRAAKSSGTLVISAQPAGTPQRAAAEAKAILGEFVPPPGAVRLATRPKLPSGSATMGLNSTAQVDAVEYWRMSGAATSLQAWEKEHISRSFSRQPDAIVGPPDWNTVYTLPAVPGLPEREMNAQFYDVGGGMTVIMADAMVTWQPPRPASEVIPASVAAVTIAQPGQAGPGSPAPVTATVTSAPVVRRLVALVNGLPVSTVGDNIPCPSGPYLLTLTFRAAVGGPAVAVVAPGGCGALTLRLNGKDEPALQPPGSYSATILKIAGLHWKLGF